jgi:hypothetical protein
MQSVHNVETKILPNDNSIPTLENAEYRATALENFTKAFQDLHNKTLEEQRFYFFKCIQDTCEILAQDKELSNGPSSGGQKR